MTSDSLNKFPIPDKEAISKALNQELAESEHKIIVLDDDPTGVQTVHDVSVYTDWSEETVREGFAETNKMIFILTNSRAMTAEETKTAHEQIGAVVAKVAREMGRSYLIISRSDSTLRGHYPLETITLKKQLEEAGDLVDGEILCPFFKEGGRFTIGNVHYVLQGEELVPAAQTEFAKDQTFGYLHSNIPEYIEEKTEGAYPAEGVFCIGLEELRRCDYDAITQKLLAVTAFQKVCVNAVDDCDVQVFAVALYRAMAAGKKFILRSAASLVKAVGGVSDRALLTREEMIKGPAESGGVVVIGSHTRKTTAQLQQLLSLENVVAIPFYSNKVLQGDDVFFEEVGRCVAEMERVIRTGKTAVCFTEREVIALEGDTKESALLRSVKISNGVQQLVGNLGVAPAFIIAKGGITSSDIGVKALKVKRANVLGQIQPGIPVWQVGPECRFPKIPYVIFPGNTGAEDTLKICVEILTGM